MGALSTLTALRAFLAASKASLLARIPFLDSRPKETPMTFPPALIDAAQVLGTAPEDLHALIQAESAWNPAAYNPSGAVGLLQFMPQTLKDYGLLSAALAEKVPTRGVVPEAVKQEVRKEFLAKWPTVEAQLRGPVVKYLSRYKPFPTRQSLYMAVFYPAYRNMPPDTAFPATVKAQNPGIDTVQDYVNHVEKRRVAQAMKGPALGAIALAGAGLLWYIGKRGGFMA